MTPVGVLFNGSMWGIVYGDHSNIMKLNSALVLTERYSVFQMTIPVPMFTSRSDDYSRKLSFLCVPL